MSNAARDIFKDIDDLKEAGMPEAQAKVILRIQHASIREAVVTKADLLGLEHRLEEKINGVEHRLEEKINAEIGSIKQEVDSLKQEVSSLKQEVSSLKQEVSSLKQEISSIKSSMEANFLYLRWMFMSILVVGGGIAIKVFFHL